LFRWLPELPVVVLGLGMNAAWEFLQSPLYADHGRKFGYLLRTRLEVGLPPRERRFVALTRRRFVPPDADVEEQPGDSPRLVRGP
jgi:hypothetical protein